MKFRDNSKVSVMGKGQITIQLNSNSTHTIFNVLFGPDLKTNLLSIGQLQEKGYEIIIKDAMPNSRLQVEFNCSSYNDCKQDVTSLSQQY